jgi:hypothetical protein
MSERGGGVILQVVERAEEPSTVAMTTIFSSWLNFTSTVLVSATEGAPPVTPLIVTVLLLLLLLVVLLTVTVKR